MGSREKVKHADYNTWYNIYYITHRIVVKHIKNTLYPAVNTCSGTNFLMMYLLDILLYYH